MDEVLEPQSRRPTQTKGLQSDAVGLISSVTIGLASTAPAFSLAATLGYIVLVVGNQAPAAILLAFIPMALTAVAYRELNRVMPDCGTTFTWGTKAFSPHVGWMGGWGIVVAGVIFVANAADVVGIYTVDLYGQITSTDADHTHRQQVPRRIDRRRVHRADDVRSPTAASRAAPSMQYFMVGLQFVVLAVGRRHRRLSRRGSAHRHEGQRRPRRSPGSTPS